MSETLNQNTQKFPRQSRSVRCAHDRARALQQNTTGMLNLIYYAEGVLGISLISADPS